MTVGRRKFYTGMAIVFPLFFLLHWNGLFSQTYYWVLLALNGTRELSGSHPGAAFVSAVVIFALLALVYEGLRALTSQTQTGGDDTSP